MFTREGKGKMYQTRSVRIDLEKFELSSENRRVLKKNSNFKIQISNLPIDDYDWSIGKMAKDFYETKFGKGTLSANKIKELLTTKHNFNLLLRYTDGYCICFQNKKILHYSYPFYNLKSTIYNLGMSMMLKAIIYAKEAGKKYVYLGSAKDAKAKYKLQFSGLEWFDGEKWRNDTDDLKKILISS